MTFTIQQEVIYTATTTIQFRMNAALKQQVEQKLDNLPKSVNADKMTDDELRDHLLTGYQEALDGKSRPATEVFAKMKANTIKVITDIPYRQSDEGGSL